MNLQYGVISKGLQKNYHHSAACGNVLRRIDFAT
jgi:hypothetical protein